MLDSDLLLRDGTSDLTADEDGTGIETKESPVDGLVFGMIVPQDLAEASDYFDCVIQESDDDSTYRDVVSFPRVEKGDGPILLTVRATISQDYVRHSITVHDDDSGGDFDAGKVLIGIAGSMERFWNS